MGSVGSKEGGVSSNSRGRPRGERSGVAKKLKRSAKRGRDEETRRFGVGVRGLWRRAHPPPNAPRPRSPHITAHARCHLHPFSLRPAAPPPARKQQVVCHQRGDRGGRGDGQRGRRVLALEDAEGGDGQGAHACGQDVVLLWEGRERGGGEGERRGAGESGARGRGADKAAEARRFANVNGGGSPPLVATRAPSAPRLTLPTRKRASWGPAQAIQVATRPAEGVCRPALWAHPSGARRLGDSSEKKEKKNRRYG